MWAFERACACTDMCRRVCALPRLICCPETNQVLVGRMMCRSPRGASLYSDNSLQTYDASMQGQGQIQNEECEGACSEISRTTHMLDEIKFFGGQNSRTLSTPIYPTCNLKPHRRRIFEETRAPASPPANRSKSVPSVIAVKRLTPKVLQRIAHAPFAAGEQTMDLSEC